MASRNTEKMHFPVLDMLRKEQEQKKNISVEKDDFSEVVQEDFRKYRLINISSVQIHFYCFAFLHGGE